MSSLTPEAYAVIEGRCPYRHHDGDGTTGPRKSPVFLRLVEI